MRLDQLMGSRNYDVNHPLARDLMSPGIYSLQKSASLQNVIDYMHSNVISAVLIFDADISRYYIITHRDIIEFLSHHGSPSKKQTNSGKFEEQSIDYSLKTTPATEIMQGPIEILDEFSPVDILIQYMYRHGYKRVIVGRHGIPRGVLSMSDVMMWTNAYFRPAKPLVLAIMDNKSQMIIGNHVYKENIHSELNESFIEMIGGALNAISLLLEEVLQQSGQLQEVEKENYTIIFEPRPDITGILFCDEKSIDLRHRLHLATNKFVEQNEAYINLLRENKGCRTLNISKIAATLDPKSQDNK